MSIQLVSFILGGVLVTIGLIGGGIEIREFKIPTVGRIPRVLAFLGGIAFISLAFISGREPGAKNELRPSETQQRQTFYTPMYGALRLDACYKWSEECGQPAATAWCKTKGFNAAVDYATENVGERSMHTQLIGTQQVCTGRFCTGFTFITCEK